MARQYRFFLLITACVSILSLFGLPSSELQAQLSFDFIEQARRITETTSASFARAEQAKSTALLFAKKNNLPTESVLPNGSRYSLQAITDGRPMYYHGISISSATTIRANQVWSGGSLGLSLNGANQVLGVWDEAAVRRTHREFATNRVTMGDNATTLSNHATHVSGTMIATGINTNARGMSNGASIRAYDWNSDEAEMRSAAGQFNIRTSNHSYGYITGWVFNLRGDGRWVWMGNPTLSATQDYRFGFYNSISRAWDSVARDFPFYLICKAAGNDRNEGPSAGTQHWVWQNGTWALSTATRDKDGGANGFDCIEGSGLSKNILTVGAVNGVSQYTGPSSVVMSSFSGYGPTDDGRIKPDVVAMGVGELSTVTTNDSAYASYSGTSMATPAVTGAIGLLLQHHATIRPNATAMRSSTIKGLLIHSADEAGDNPGPDYRFGWGLVNIARATQIMSINANRTQVFDIQELALQNNQSLTINGTSNGSEPIRVTICWNDPAGIPTSAQNNPTTSMLRNDLDVRVQRNGSSTQSMPWVLNPANPSQAATTGDNIRDNVEQILISQPQSGAYTITINHKGSLVTGSQIVSVIISGMSPNSVTANAGEDKTICVGNSTTLNGQGTGTGTLSYAWRVLGSTTVIDTTPNLTVSPSQTTTYRLTVSNGSGTATDDVVVNVNTRPTSNAGTDRTINAGSTTTLSAVGAVSGIQYQWINLSSNQVVSQSASVGLQLFNTTSFQLTATNPQTQCLSRDTVVVTVNPVTVTANAGTDRFVCANSVISITGNGRGAGTLTYTWLNLTSNSVIQNRVLNDTVPTTRSYQLTVTDQAGNSALDTVVVNTIGAWQPTITSTSAVCRNRQVRHNVQSIPGATYQWTATNGTLISGATTNSCVIAWSGSASQGTIGVSITLGSCNTSITNTLTLNAPPTPTFTASPSCINETRTYSTANVTGSTYQWSLPQQGGTLVSGATTNAVAVNWTVSGTRQLRLLMVNSAGCNSTNTQNITINQTPAPTINVNNTTSPKVGDSRTYSVQSISGRTYSWSVSSGGSITSQTNTSVTVQWNNPGSASVSVTETITNAQCSGTTTNTIVVSQSFDDNESSTLTITDMNVEVYSYPNPVSERLMIDIPGTTSGEQIVITISTLSGKEVLTEQVTASGGMYSIGLNVASYSNGVYVMNVTKGNAKKQLKFLKQ
jgi:hypothetical protein